MVTIAKEKTDHIEQDLTTNSVSQMVDGKRVC